jgi:hypothetical protein
VRNLKLKFKLKTVKTYKIYIKIILNERMMAIMRGDVIK